MIVICMHPLMQKYPLELGDRNLKLRTKCDRMLFPLSPEQKKFAHTLMELMRLYDGVGLAAPQIGLPVCMIATSQWKVAGDNYTNKGETLMINPEIVESSDEKQTTEEGCLSLP